MTVVKDDEVSTAEEVPGVSKVAEAEDEDEMDLMTDSKLPDDWSIIESKGLDNEGSDGESVEVIPCEEEKSEAESSIADGTPPSALAVETREKMMQTEDIVFFRNFNIWHPGVAALSIVCHLLICFVFYSTNDGDPLDVTSESFQSNLRPIAKEILTKDGDRLDVTSESIQSNLRPIAREIVDDWFDMSPRPYYEKEQIKNMIWLYFPFRVFQDEIAALLERDTMKDSSVAAFHRSRRYPHDSPPRVPIKQKYQRPIHSAFSADVPATKNTEANEHKFGQSPNSNGENPKFDCLHCKKYSSDCKKFCKHHKGKNWRYYYDKIKSAVAKRFPSTTVVLNTLG